MAISTPDSGPADQPTTPRRWSRLARGRATQRFVHNRTAVAALAVILVLVVIAVLGVLVAPHDPNAQDLRHTLENPSSRYLLGTDRFGRDTLSRLIVATRVTIWAAVQGLGVAVVIGVPLG